MSTAAAATTGQYVDMVCQAVDCMPQCYINLTKSVYKCNQINLCGWSNWLRVCVCVCVCVF